LLALGVGGFHWNRSIGIDDIDTPSHLSQSIGQNIASNLGTRKQDPSLIIVVREWKRFEQRFGNEPFGNKVGHKVVIGQNFCGSLAYCRNLYASEIATVAQMLTESRRAVC
jgi:hypothetical protein